MAIRDWIVVGRRQIPFCPCSGYFSPKIKRIWSELISVRLSFFNILSIRRPPALVNVILLFFFSQLFQLIRRISQNTVKNTAAVVFPVGVTLIRQVDHFFNEFQRFRNVQVAWFHALSLSGWHWGPGHDGRAILAVFEPGCSTCNSKFVPEVTAWLTHTWYQLISECYRPVSMFGKQLNKISSANYAIHENLMI